MGVSDAASGAGFSARERSDLKAETKRFEEKETVAASTMSPDLCLEIRPFVWYSSEWARPLPANQDWSELKCTKKDVSKKEHRDSKAEHCVHLCELLGGEGGHSLTSRFSQSSLQKFHQRH
jgi:hypothetical protein